MGLLVLVQGQQGRMGLLLVQELVQELVLG